MEKLVTAIIEKGTDNRYSIFISDKEYPYGIIGTGESVKEAMDDFNAGYQEMKDYVLSTGDSFEGPSFIFK